MIIKIITTLRFAYDIQETLLCNHSEDTGICQVCFLCDI